MKRTEWGTEVHYVYKDGQVRPEIHAHATKSAAQEILTNRKSLSFVLEAHLVSRTITTSAWQRTPE